MKPFISFIVCSYNAPELILKCINSILKQDYYGKKEIIIVDGGSDEKTLEVLDRLKNEYKSIKILHNKNRLPEGYGRGKWLGWKKARGKYVFMIDQDNELQGRDCVKEMLLPFKEKRVFGCACRVKIDKNDSLTNQYVALMGTDPFFAYRSLDGLINIKKIGKNKRKYSLIKMGPGNIIITGGNCFVYNKDILDKLGGYIQDTQNIMNLVNSGYDCVAITKDAYTHHFAAKGFLNFIKKKVKWAKAYQYVRKKYTDFSYLPSTKNERRKMLINIFCIITIMPTLLLALKKMIETREKAWLLHPVLTFITGFIYLDYFLFPPVARIEARTNKRLFIFLNT